MKVSLEDPRMSLRFPNPRIHYISRSIAPSLIHPQELMGACSLANVDFDNALNFSTMVVEE